MHPRAGRMARCARRVRRLAEETGLFSKSTGGSRTMAMSRAVAPWSLASLAFTAIAMGFHANEPSMAPSSGTKPLADATAVVRSDELQRRSEVSVPPADFIRRAHVAGSSAPLGASDGTQLQRARLSRGEPGLQVSNTTTPAARTRVTPVALRPPAQPGLSAARHYQRHAHPKATASVRR